MSAKGQEGTMQVERHQSSPVTRTLNFSDPALEDWEPLVVTIKEAPKPASDYGNKKALLHQQRLQHQRAKQSRAAQSLPDAPVMLTNFNANVSQATPNDNHIAISNGGKIVSVVNTNLRIYNDTGALVTSKSLATFANALGLLTQISDPKVVYDPIADRFILVFFTGNTSTKTRIIVGFSQSNDPAQQWNFYALSGNMLNDSTWSDYPIISISDKDFFMTFNHLKDGFDWKTGFRYSAIWQIDKQRGYDGDTLQFNFWHDVKYNGAPVWNVSTVQGGSTPVGPEAYFLSVRPGDLSNDTVFLHKISDSYQSGNAQFSSQVLTTNINYGVPPDAAQRGGQFLATNDSRVLSAFIENDRIQWVQNTINPSTFTSGVYVGQIDNVSNNPSVTGTIIANDTVDYGYPSIAYLGNNQWDNRAIVTCSYSSPDTFPGTVAFYRDAQGNTSQMLVVKPGESEENVLLDSVERWGDYTGIQRKYNEPNTAWLAGSYVSTAHNYRTWIAKVVNTDSALVSSIGSIQTPLNSMVFPNPATEQFSLQVDLPKGNFTGFTLYDAAGNLVRTILEDNCKAGTSIFSFNTQHLANGIYFLKITDKGSLLKTEKIIIHH